MSRPIGSKNKVIPKINKRTYVDKVRDKRERYQTLLSKTELTNVEKSELLTFTWTELSNASFELELVNQKQTFLTSKKKELHERICKLLDSLDVELE